MSQRRMDAKKTMSVRTSESSSALETTSSNSMRESFARPRRKSMMAQTELPVVDAESEKLMEDDTVVPANAVKGVQAFYASQKKHIWFTISAIVVFIAAFIIFERLYPQAKAVVTTVPDTVPPKCQSPDIRGCYDFEECILPGFDPERYPALAMPICKGIKDPCGYQCTCEETKPSQLSDADFAIPGFLFFTPKVPSTQAGLGGAFLLLLLATLLLRQKHSVKDPRYMAGSGKNEYEEWKLYVFPARKNFPGVAMMVLFVAWAIFQFVGYAWLVVPTLDNPQKFTRNDCVLTQMVDNRFCWTLIFIIPSSIVFLIVGFNLERFKSLMVTHCPVSAASHVELLLVKITSTKLKGSVVLTKHYTRFLQLLERQVGDVSVDLEKQDGVVSFEAYGIRYVYIGESSASPPTPQFVAIGKHVMTDVTMAAIDSYFTQAVATQGAAAGQSRQLPELPHSKTNVPAGAETFIHQFHPLARPQKALNIVGQNYVPVEIPSFVEAWLLELSKPFYVFQFMCCVLWTIDNYIPYGYGLMFLLLLGSGQGAYVTIKSKKDMKKLVDKQYEVEVLRQDGVDGPSKWTTIPHFELLPGDIVKILAGKPVPADCILMRGSVLMDESMLTGEALPLSKSHPEHMDQKVYTPMMKKCTLYADTLCLKSNDAVAIVGKTGMFTMKGELLQTLIMPVQYQPQYQKEANFALFLMFVYAIWNYVIVVFLGVKRDPATQFKCANFIFGLEAIAMVIPPILPLAVLIGLNISVVRLNKKSIFTFQVNRIGIIGGTKIMCFDKTGTITEDGMRFKNVRPVSSDAASPSFAAADLAREDLVNAPGSLLTKAMATCHSLEELKGKLVGNAVDMEMFGGVGFELGASAKTYQQGAVSLTVVKQFEFIHALQTMAVIVREASGSQHAFCKGSYERIKARLAPASIPADYDSVCTGLAKAGAYVLAIGGKSLEGRSNVQQMSREEVECDLTLLGLLVFLNDVKESSPAAFKAISDGGINCKIITGDNAFTAVKVARAIAMNEATATTNFYVGDVKESELVFRDYDTDAEIPAGEIYNCVQRSLLHFHDCVDDKCPRPLPFALCVTGAALEFCESELRLQQYHAQLSQLNVVPAISIFARVSPAQKADVVTDIEEAGAVVGMCGDGGNDVNALRQATFGFALSTTDAGIAAPFSTNRKDLTSLVELLIEGRASLTTNFGAFKYMLLYGLFYSFYNLGNNFHGGYFSTKQFYWMDFGLNLMLTIAVTSSEPSDTLIKGLPPSSIYSLPVQVSIWTPCVISAVLLIVCFYWTTNQSWYIATPTGFADGTPFPSDAPVRGILSKNHLSTVYYHACSWCLMISAFIFTYGGYFRQAIWRNKFLIVSMAGCIVVASLLILLPSEGQKVPILRSDLAEPPMLHDVNALDEAWDLHPMPHDFKVQLYFLIIGFMAAMALAEWCIVILFQKIDGISGWQRLMEQIVGDSQSFQHELTIE